MFLFIFKTSLASSRYPSGAGDRSRTYDLRITNALLYQLSYTGPSCFTQGRAVYGFARLGKRQMNASIRLPSIEAKV